jgi:hypothetical protein
MSASKVMIILVDASSKQFLCIPANLSKAKSSASASALHVLSLTLKLRVNQKTYF